MGTPDCQDCGACCFGGEGYVRVSGDDHARLGDRADDLVVWDGIRAFLRMKDGHCAALVRDGARWACSIYALRPTPCRELERGTPACEAEIERKAVLVSLRRAKG